MTGESSSLKSGWTGLEIFQGEFAGRGSRFNREIKKGSEGFFHVYLLLGKCVRCKFVSNCKISGDLWDKETR